MGALGVEACPGKSRTVFVTDVPVWVCLFELRKIGRLPVLHDLAWASVLPANPALLRR